MCVECFDNGWSSHINQLPMKRLATQLPLVILLLLVIFSCNKEEQEPVTPLLFKSLTASSTSFPHGETVQLTADVDGTNVIYNWTYSQGEVSGSGSSVLYSCDIPGAHTIICTVKDAAGNIADKQLVLQVQ